MGHEISCRADIDGTTVRGKAYLETESILFRGDVRLVVPFAEIANVRAENGKLLIEFSGQRVAFELGPSAETWAEKIRNRRTLVEKLGVKEGATISLVGVDNDEFIGSLKQQGASVFLTRPAKENDAIFLQLRSARDLERLAKLKTLLKPNGALWLLRAKGGDIKESDTISAGKAAGLVDVKVVRFSQTLSAEKLVIPRSARR